MLIVGGRGTVTQTLARLCEQRGLVYRLLSDRDVDLADRASVEDCLTRRQPWAVVDVTGWESGNEAEGEPRRCSCANRPRPAVLAEACCGREVALLILAPGLCSCAHSSPEALVVRRNTSVGLPALIEEQVNTCLDLLLDGEQGVWQLSHTGSAPGTFPAQQVESTLGKGTEGTGARFMRESRGEGKTLPAPPADRSLPFPWPVPYNEP